MNNENNETLHLNDLLSFLWEPNIEIECLWKISRNQFQHIKNVLDSYKTPENIITNESIYDNDTKVIYNPNTNNTIVQKKELLKIIPFDNYKIKASTEIITPETTNVFKLQRNKNRYRYTFHWFYIDITEIKSKNNIQTFELELELNIDVCRSYNINNISKYFLKQIHHLNQLLI